MCIKRFSTIINRKILPKALGNNSFLANSVRVFPKIRNCPVGAFLYKALQSSVR